MEQEVQQEVQCPYCGEWIQLWLDPTDLGELTMDCEVCCRPWVVRVWRDGESLGVDVDREQE